ncbi:MAG: NmrA/HSCARG family protein [Gemmatimonadota bacterium]|nr:NmrA/HSCARG family protein [Gemmatimonadota bacterium]
MSERKTIAVIGATGAQGGGLVRAILSDDDGFAARAVTRNPDSEKGRALADSGAEVVRADLDDVDSLLAAFDGCHGAYCVTNFWEHFSPEKELAQAGNLAAATAGAGVRHVVWSTLEDTRRFVSLDDDRLPTLQDRYKVPHFDAKGEADGFFDPGRTTRLMASYYWDNLIYFGQEPQRDESGRLVFSLPMGDAPLAGIAAEDIGKCAHGIFQAGVDMLGEVVGIAGEHLTGAEMAAALSEALGEEVVYQAVPFDVYRSLGFPGAEDLGNMFQFYHDFGEAVLGARDVETSRRLNPELLDFEAWLRKYGDRIPRH